MEGLSRDSELRDILAEMEDVCQGRSNVQPIMEMADLPVAVGPKMADRLSVSLFPSLVRRKKFLS